MDTTLVCVASHATCGYCAEQVLLLIRLHYIPLSASYQEIYNIHAFFSGATQSTLKASNSTTLQLPSEQRKAIDGDRRLRRIARAGKQWKRTLGRRVDMEGKIPQNFIFSAMTFLLTTCDLDSVRVQTMLGIR